MLTVLAYKTHSQIETYGAIASERMQTTARDEQEITQIADRLTLASGSLGTGVRLRGGCPEESRLRRGPLYISGH